MLGKLADYYMIAANGACVNDIAAIVLCICSQCGICSQMTTVTSSLLQRFVVPSASIVFAAHCANHLTPPNRILVQPENAHFVNDITKVR